MNSRVYRAKEPSCASHTGELLAANANALALHSRKVLMCIRAIIERMAVGWMDGWTDECVNE